MNCPHCCKPIDAAAIRKAVNADAAKRKRPGALGLVRNPRGRPKKDEILPGPATKIVEKMIDTTDGCAILNTSEATSLMEMQDGSS